MIDSIFLSKSLTERFGLDVSATVKDSFNTDGVNDGQKIIIEPAGVENTISFKVELTLGWRTLSAVFRPADYASILLKKMNKFCKIDWKPTAPQTHTAAYLFIW